MMPSRNRSLNDEDRAAWSAFANKVAMLPGRAAPPPATAPPVPGVREAAVVPAAPERRRGRLAPLSIGSDPGGLDRASWQRLSRGRQRTERQLDLHGRTAQAAFVALQTFLAAAQADGVRCVEVITGRGAGETGGVLRRELPNWLNLPALRPLVLAAAYPHPANRGAIRLLLRRAR